MEEYDFLVVGSGSGLEVANVAADRGQSVAVVEKGPLGGTCLNRGCIPSKELLYRAEVVETVERAGAFHVEATLESVDVSAMVREVTEEVREEAAAIRRGLASSDRHDLYLGEGRFVDDRTVAVTGMEESRRDGDGSEGADGGGAAVPAGEEVRLRAETVVIAAGTRPSIPDVDGIDDVPSLTSTEALRLEEPPDHLVVIGGGYVAAELGHFFGTVGSDVTIVGRRPTLLPEADREVAAAFTDRYAERFTVHTGYEATAVSGTDGGLTVEAWPYTDDTAVDRSASAQDAAGDRSPNTDDTEGVTATGDALLVAAGRRPNTDLLDVDAAGVETDARGFVETDEYLRTTAEGVWALGDVVGEYLLKHSANHEARAVARNLFGDGLEPVDYTAMPFAVFGSPEVAGVGVDEESLHERGVEYATNTYRYEDTARGQATKSEGFVKVIVGLDGEILGCHVIGPDASTLVQEVVVAMTAGSGTVRDIREAVHVHPALPEVVQRAFSGQFTHHHHDHEDGDGGAHGHDHHHGGGPGHDHDGGPGHDHGARSDT